MILEFIEFFDKAANLPLAVVISLVFIGLIIYVSVITFPRWYREYHRVIENNTLSTQQQSLMVKNMAEATKSSAEATKAVSESVNLLREFLQERATKEAIHYQETKELRGEINQVQDDVQGIHIEVSKLGVQFDNICKEVR